MQARHPYTRLLERAADLRSLQAVAGIPGVRRVRNCGRQSRQLRVPEPAGAESGLSVRADRAAGEHLSQILRSLTSSVYWFYCTVQVPVWIQ